MQVGEILMMKTVWVCIDNWYSQKRVSFWKASRKYEFGNGEAQKRKSHHILINSTILFLHPLSKGRRTRLRLQQPNHHFGGQQSCLLKILYTKSTHIIFRSGQLNLWSTRCQIPNLPLLLPPPPTQTALSLSPLHPLLPHLLRQSRHQNLPS